MKLRLITYRFVLLLIFISSINTISIAQTEKDIKANAQQQYHEKHYAKAAELYYKLLKDNPDNIEYIYNYANTQRLLLNYTKAYNYYSELIEKNATDSKPRIYYYHAQAAKQLGHYKEAIDSYRKYITNGSTNSLRVLSEQDIEACRFSITHQFDSSEYTITHLPPPINSKFSEFNPVPISSNELVFSRYQSLFDDSIDNVFNQTYYSDIYISRLSQRGWKKEKLFSEQFSNNKYFNGNICFNKENTEAYFTRCIDNDGEIGNCAIYHSIKRKGKWSKPKKLSNKVNVSNYSSTHSYLVKKKDYNILYFSSNRPNGFGGFDIWYAIIKDNNINQVSNLGSIINTSGNEYTPFYDINQELLYFSSDKHNGFGGFDIFKSSGELNSWKKPINLGMPLNSPANDYYYTHKRDGKLVYFASNRKGSYYHSNMENCCSDIYKAERIDIETPLIGDSIPSDSIPQDTTVIAIRKLLPLSLYFGNDQPNPNTLKTVTKYNYKDLLSDYIIEKEEFIKAYSKGLQGEEKANSDSIIEQFFEDNVKTGFNNLELFSKLLKSELENGKKVRIKIKGYASPLNSAEYNLALSKRRISSLKNYIKEFDDGYFLQYLKEKDKQKASLTIFEDPLGDSQSIGYVSDSWDDKRNSIYSPEASLQRKIQIIMYSSSQETIDSADYPILKLKHSKIKLGEIKKGNNKSAIVYFENIGSAELKLLSLKPDCDCISIQAEQRTFQTKEKGKFYFLIRTNNLKTGDYSQKLRIQTDEIENIRTITISFKVIEP